MVIWVIGMSASGKTTLGLEMYKFLKKTDDKWIFLDGDMIRAMMGDNLGHTLEDRKKNGYRISRLCKILDMQGFNVISCVLSISRENQEYNRKIFPDYKQVFIDVELKKLIERDNKKLYSKALNGEINNVVGIDINFPRPLNPDYTLDNNIDNLDFTDEAINILKYFNIKISEQYEYTKENRIKYPERYQYTDYEGKFFFEKYKKNREKVLDLLKYKLYKKGCREEYLNEENEIRTYIYNNLRKHIESDDNTLITKMYLIELWNKVKKHEALEEDIKNIFKLINKFEVSKKIYYSYEKGSFKNNSLSYDHYINYIIFSNLLLSTMNLSISNNKRYIIFNTILKLNDLIISLIDNLLEEDQILLVYICIKNELINYYKIKEENCVRCFDAVSR